MLECTCGLDSIHGAHERILLSGDGGSVEAHQESCDDIGGEDLAGWSGAIASCLGHVVCGVEVNRWRERSDARPLDSGC